MCPQLHGPATPRRMKRILWVPLLLLVLASLFWKQDVKTYGFVAQRQWFEEKTKPARVLISAASNNSVEGGSLSEASDEATETTPQASAAVNRETWNESTAAKKTLALMTKNESKTKTRSNGFLSGKEGDRVKSDYQCLLKNCKLEKVCVDPNMKQIRNRGYRGEAYIIHLFGPSAQDMAPQVENILFQAQRDRFMARFEAHNTTDELVSSFPSYKVEYSSRAAVTDRFVGGNCGHQLGDDAVAILRLLRKFSSPTNRVDHLFYKTRFRERCDEVLFNVAETYFIPRSQPKRTFMCYDSLYIGTDNLAYMARGGTQAFDTLESDLMAFRSIAYQRAGVSSSTPSAPAESSTSETSLSTAADTIVVMEKLKGKHMSNIENRYELIDFIKQQYPAYKVELVCWGTYGNLFNQIQLLSRTKVLISLPGSDVMNAIFLPNGSTLLMFCRVFGHTHLDLSNEYKYWFQHLSFIKTVVDPNCNTTRGVYYNFTTSNTEITDFLEFNRTLSKLLL